MHPAPATAAAGRSAFGFAPPPFRPKDSLVKLKLPVMITAASLALTAHAAEEYFDLQKELSSSYVKELLAGSDVKLYVGSEPVPAFVEVTRPDVYSSMSFSPSPFGGSRRHCLDAFQKSLTAMFETAKARGYDAIIGLRPVVDGVPSDDVSGFKCTPGYKVTRVPLSSSFAMSEAAARREAESEKQSLELPARPPAKGAVFLPVAATLASDEAKVALGGVPLHWGVQAPAYSHRYGPDVYPGDAEVVNGDAESACRRAFLNALASVAGEAKSQGFNSIIKARSYLDEEFAPALGEVECQVGKKAKVQLRATLAQAK